MGPLEEFGQIFRYMLQEVPVHAVRTWEVTD